MHGLKLLGLVVLITTLLTRSAYPAGVTVITHGFSGNVDGWVLGMAQRMPSYPTFSGTNVICYEMLVVENGSIVVTSSKLAGGHPTNDPNAEIVIKLDWGALAGFFAQYDTYEVAAAVVPKFLQTNFIAELGGRALAELPIHLIGHSRGGSLVCEMARLLGMRGVWVDHVTTLDPHPVNQDGNVDPFSVSDAPLRIYENVLFADNYYQTFGGYPGGQFMPSSYNRGLTNLPGGYTSAHSDTHLWYHATIDLRNPANDTEALLSATNRSIWFTPYEMSGTNAGFHYSRIGPGDRLKTDQPAGEGTDRPVLGFNQRWDLGAGQGTNNRTPLPSNTGAWPNVIRFNLTGTNLMAWGSSNSVTFHAQWAQPASSNAAISVHMDDDFNPYNANDQLLQLRSLPGTGSNQIAIGTIYFDVATTNSTVGLHSVYAKISDGNRTRYAYAPETLTVVSSSEPPHLGINKTGTSVQISISGIPGQRIVLEGTSDFSTWTPLATNWMDAATWSYSEPQGSHRFYRASNR